MTAKVVLYCSMFIIFSSIFIFELMLSRYSFINYQSFVKLAVLGELLLVLVLSKIDKKLIINSLIMRIVGGVASALAFTVMAKLIVLS